MKWANWNSFILATKQLLQSKVKLLRTGSLAASFLPENRYHEFQLESDSPQNAQFDQDFMDADLVKSGLGASKSIQTIG